MKAAQIAEYGDSSVIRINEIKKPEVRTGQVLVEVHASSLNPFDTSIREGSMKEMIPLDLPVTLGGDIAGVVTEVGDDIVSVLVGDNVYGQANVVAGNSGAFAEFAATKAGQIAKAPEGLGFKEAASLPLVGVSAWQALVQHIQLEAGQKIFVHGGAGGIGTIAIQIAKHIGARVATTATGDGIEFVKQLGADEVIDYTSQDFTELVSGYDAVFDTTPGDASSKLLTILRPGGIAVSMLAQVDEEKARTLDVRVVTQSTHVTTEALDALRKLVESGVVSPQIDKVFSLEQIGEAFEARESGAVRGKVVISIRQ